MSKPSTRPLVLMHCEWTRDNELVGQLLREIGADFHAIEQSEETRRILAADRADLILADSGGAIGSLMNLLAFCDNRPGGADLPMVLLANLEDLPLLSELTARRFNALLLTKPMSREQLAAAVESGLRLRARQRQVRDLLVEVSASNDRLATANLALEQRRAEAAEEARRKTRFLSAISHDIRTPVNALVLSCELLRAIGQVSPAATIDVRDIDDLTGALLNNAAALVELVNDLLDIARHDQGKLELAEADFPLGDFLTGTIEGMRPLAEQKRLDLILDIATPTAVLRTDRIKLARVVQNLVANAIKFTDAGRVRVQASASTISGLAVQVEDTGIGIPGPLREGIFDEFAQLRNPERDRTKGTGLGLAICRRLVQTMGGTIAVVTAPEQSGSTFEVTLPPSRVTLDGALQTPTDPLPIPPGPNRYRGEVLVVEDHEPSRVLLQRLLRQVGLTVRTAENGQEALDQVERSRPDLVLMDLMMPVLGGLETLRVLRAAPLSRDLGVIILTGDPGNRTSDALAVEGASAFLSKPVEVPLLLEMLGRFLPAADSDASPSAEFESDRSAALNREIKPA